MEPTEPLAGLQCIECETQAEPDVATHTCPDCGGQLNVTYDLDTVELGRVDLEPSVHRGMAAYGPLLPVPVESLPNAGTGATPLVDAPDLAADLGVASVSVKDEGSNPTGGLVDRELAVAVAAARRHGADDVALPSMGNAGQAAAAAAARLGLDSHAFVPTRTPFVNKAMINVHGGDMSVVEGRYRDAAEAFAEAVATEDWYSVAAFETPYRHEGAKTVAYEVLAQRNWSVPDGIVVPTGHGTALAGLYRGFREVRDLGLIDRVPPLYAAQASGCAPVAAAWDAGRTEPEAVDHPDTICGPLEIPDPTGGKRVLEAIADTDGGAVATDDDTILEHATSLASEGIPISVTGGAAVGGAQVLADRGTLVSGDDVVLVNPLSGNKEADLLRSHLMGQGR